MYVVVVRLLSELPTAMTLCPCLWSPVMILHRVMVIPGKKEAKVSPSMALTLLQSEIIHL